MKNISLLATLTLVTGLVAACQSGSKARDRAVSAPPVAPTALPTTLEESIASSYRTAVNTERDRYRHPVETLKFFGIKPTMTVVEIWPGGGWYMEILAPYLSQKGQYIAALPAGDGGNFTEMNDKLSEWLKAHPDLDAKVTRTVFNPPDTTEVAPKNSADMIFTFRNVHNWMANNAAQQAFNGFYKALKPGGILGVVEHRANPKMKPDAQAKSGYVLEKDILKFAKAAGFRFEKRSEINANPKDTKDYPEGVWTLPPTLKLGDKDKERYLDIGESDRMTLRFVKPLPRSGRPIVPRVEGQSK